MSTSPLSRLIDLAAEVTGLERSAVETAVGRLLAAGAAQRREFEELLGALADRGRQTAERARDKLGAELGSAALMARLAALEARVAALEARDAEAPDA